MFRDTRHATHFTHHTLGLAIRERNQASAAIHRDDLPAADALDRHARAHDGGDQVPLYSPSGPTLPRNDVSRQDLALLTPVSFCLSLLAVADRAPGGFVTVVPHTWTRTEKAHVVLIRVCLV